MLSQPEDEHWAWDILYRAAGWWHERRLDAAFLVQAPRLWMWRASDTVYLRWDNRERVIEGIPVWQARAGECSMPTTEFFRETESFHNRLMAAMWARIQEAKASWPRTDVILDFDDLEREHARRADFLFPAGRPPAAATDWDDVMAAMSEIDAEIA